MNQLYAKYSSLALSHGIVCEHLGGTSLGLELKVAIVMIQSAPLGLIYLLSQYLIKNTIIYIEYHSKYIFPSISKYNKWTKTMPGNI